MKVVILNGSNHKTGVTKGLYDYIFKDLAVEIIEHWAYYENYRACLDCQYCFRNENECIVKDDFQLLMNDLLDADLFVLASPLHFSSFSAQLLQAISRMQYLFAYQYVHKKPSQFKPKKALTIISGGNDYQTMFDAIKPVDSIIYSHANVKEIKRLLIKSSDKYSIDDLINENINQINDTIEYVKEINNEHT